MKRSAQITRLFVSFAALLLLTGELHAGVLTWGTAGTNDWTAGNPTNTSTVSQLFRTTDANIDAIVTVAQVAVAASGSSAVWSTTAPDQSLRTNDIQTGGNTPVHNGLFISLQSQPNTSSYIQVTVQFVLASNTNTAARVTGVNTGIFDVDANNTATNYFTDQIYNIQGISSTGTVGIMSASNGGSTGTDNLMTGGTGLGTVFTGTGAYLGGSGANNDTYNTGNITFGFGSQTITGFSFQWADVNITDQQIQRITLDNVNFSSTPEAGSGVAAALVCFGALAVHKFRSRHS